MKLEIVCEVVFTHRVTVTREVPEDFDLGVFHNPHSNWISAVKDEAMLATKFDSLKNDCDVLVSIADLNQ
jgi:hypothetical protein